MFESREFGVLGGTRTRAAAGPPSIDRSTHPPIHTIQSNPTHPSIRTRTLERGRERLLGRLISRGRRSARRVHLVVRRHFPSWSCGDRSIESGVRVSTNSIALGGLGKPRRPQTQQCRPRASKNSWAMHRSSLSASKPRPRRGKNAESDRSTPCCMMHAAWKKPRARTQPIPSMNGWIDRCGALRSIDRITDSVYKQSSEDVDPRCGMEQPWNRSTSD